MRTNRSRRNRLDRMCNGKVRHADRLSAVIAAKRLNNKQIAVYKCPKCHKWHLGHSNRNHMIQARIDQLLREVPGFNSSTIEP